MTENPLFNHCYKTRCLHWFKTTEPTDAHVVPDNFLTNERRLGSFLVARELLAVPGPVPVTGLVAGPNTS
eukprot:11661287-Heterocapsa_arctica.AAC.2